MNLNDLRMSLKAALDNMWARIDARITAIEQGGGGGGVTSVNGQTGDVSITPANIGAVAKTGDTMTGALTIKDNSQPKLQFSDSDGITGFIQGYPPDHRITFAEYTPNGNGHYENYVLPAPTADTEDKLYSILTDKNILTSNIIEPSYGKVTYYKSLHTCTVVMTLSGLPVSGWQAVCYGLPAAAASMYFVIYGRSNGPCTAYISTTGQLMFNGQGTQSATDYSFTYVTAT